MAEAAVVSEKCVLKSEVKQQQQAEQLYNHEVEVGQAIDGEGCQQHDQCVDDHRPLQGGGAQQGGVLIFDFFFGKNKGGAGAQDQQAEELIDDVVFYPEPAAFVHKIIVDERGYPDFKFQPVAKFSFVAKVEDGACSEAEVEYHSSRKFDAVRQQLHVFVNYFLHYDILHYVLHY